MAIRNFGKHGRRKVSVPNVTGSTRSNAQIAITSAQLTYSESSTNTSDIGLSQVVQSQGVSSGSVVLIGSNIPFTYYNYVAPPVVPPVVPPVNPPVNPPVVPPVTPPVAPTINSITESSTCTTISINWSGSNAASYAVTNSTGWTSPTSGEGTTVTIGLPDDVTITNNLNVGGNLNVTGTINSVNTTQVNIVDNKINLNTDFTGAPTADAGIRVERGEGTDVEILWNETDDRWTLTNNGTNYHAIARKYAANLANPSSLTYIQVNHNLGTSDVTVQVFETAGSKALVEADVERTSDDAVTIKFATAPASGAYRVVITG